jgi:hypothetical protein
VDSVERTVREENIDCALRRAGKLKLASNRDISVLSTETSRRSTRMLVLGRGARNPNAGSNDPAVPG